MEIFHLTSLRLLNRRLKPLSILLLQGSPLLHVLSCATPCPIRSLNHWYPKLLNHPSIDHSTLYISPILIPVRSRSQNIPGTLQNPIKAAEDVATVGSGEAGSVEVLSTPAMVMQPARPPQIK